MIRIDSTLTDKAVNTCIVVQRHQEDFRMWANCPQRVKRLVTDTDIDVLWCLSQSRENWQQD